MSGVATLLRVITISVAILGGALSIFAAAGQRAGRLSPERAGRLQRVSYWLMGLSMLCFAVGGLLG